MGRKWLDLKQGILPNSKRRVAACAVELTQYVNCITSSAGKVSVNAKETHPCDATLKALTECMRKSTQRVAKKSTNLSVKVRNLFEGRF